MSMVPTVFFIVLLALVWLFLMLCAMWSSDRGVAGRPLSQLITLPRKRSHAPKPFAGLTYTPHRAACEQEATSPKEAPAVPPNPMPASNRCPRRVDTSMHFCPHPTCEYRRWVGLRKPACHWPSQRRSLASVSSPRVRGLRIREPWDDLSWQTRAGGADGPRHRVLG